MPIKVARDRSERHASRAALPRDYDVLVIGSGFGGSVTALRLTEKGYRVGVLEAGRKGHGVPSPTWIPAANQTTRRK
jgi:cholesterol oxidase